MQIPKQSYCLLIISDNRAEYIVNHTCFTDCNTMFVFSSLKDRYLYIYSGLVTDYFCTGVLTPVLRQGNDPSVCGSYRPITVFSV